MFYGGLAQFCAGMWEFRNRNVFGATAFSTYGGFWMGIGVFVILAETTGFLGGYKAGDITNALAWFILSFAIFNTYMLIGSMRVNMAVFGVFLTLEITEILLAIGNFNAVPHRREAPVVGARRRMDGHRHCRRRLVHLRGRRLEQPGGQDGASGRQADDELT